MKFVLIFISLAFFKPAFLNAQISYDPFVEGLMNEVDQDTLFRYTRQLSGDTACDIGGSSYTITTRHYSKPGNAMAAQYILERFVSYGLSAWNQQITGTLVNVLARKTGTKYPNQYFIICAHYDNMPSTTPAPGADDNATGTAAVLEAARVLSNKSFPYTILFAAWDEEERGLYGSRAYADTARRLGDSILGVLNFDMIGYDGNSNGAMDINTNPASNSLANDFFQVVQIYQPSLVPQITTSLNGGSDHQSFQAKNYMAILSIEDNSDFNPYYHTVNDNYSRLNKPYFLKMTKAGVAGLVTLAGNYKNIIRLEFAAGIEGMWNGAVQVKDTMRIFLRSSFSPYQVADASIAFLDNQGTAWVTFENAPNGSYYIQLSHRNALEIWSNAPVGFQKGIATGFDFRSSQSMTYGNNSVFISGRYCTYSGDVNQDGVIDGADGVITDNMAFQYQSGYVNADLDGNNFVDASDLRLIDNNAFNFVQVRRPGMSLARGGAD